MVANFSIILLSYDLDTSATLQEQRNAINLKIIGYNTVILQHSQQIQIFI